MVEIDRVQQHLLSLGFKPDVVNPFVKRVATWVDKSGEEWVVQRFKALKLYLLAQLEEREISIPEGFASFHTRNRVCFKDPMIRMVMDLPNEGASLLRKEGFVRLYQVFKLNTMSAKQKAGYKESITSPYTGTHDALQEGINTVTAGIRDIIRDCSISREDVNMANFTPLRLWSKSDKRSPVFKVESDTNGIKTVKVRTMSRMSVESHNFVDVMSSDRLLQSLWRTYPFDVSRCMVGGGESIMIQGASPKDMVDVPAGRISNIQEGGCKLRTVANPFLALQALGEPLKRKLETLTRDFSEVSTFDQSSSHETIAKWLKEGREIASYDLTAFTDRFPYALQRVVLTALKDEGYISAFDYDVMELVVSKEWVSQDHGPMKWEVGQPMGFGPSFHLATLTHLALMRGMKCRMCRIVGDDIVISDHLAAKRYEMLMTSMGVKISAAKSLISNRFAEFCGKIISADGVNPSIKLKHISGEDQLVRLIGYYGPQALNFMSHSELKMARKVKLPLDQGGLGVPLPGESYDEYISSLHTDLIAESCLRSSLQEALGLSSYGTMQELFEWLLSFDENNRLLSKHGESVLGVSPIGVTGITSSNLFTHGRVDGMVYNGAYRTSTVKSLVDNYVRDILASGTKMPNWIKVFYFSPCGNFIERRDDWGLTLKADIIRSTKNDDQKGRPQSSNRFFKTERQKAATRSQRGTNEP